MAASAGERIAHIKDAIAHIRSLRAEASDAQIRRDPILRAALERFFEIISEASRHIPAERQAAYPHIPWKRIAGIGNILRHAYDGVDVDVLLNATGADLDDLDRAVTELIARSAE